MHWGEIQWGSGSNAVRSSSQSDVFHLSPWTGLVNLRSVYHNIARRYGRVTGIAAQVNGLCVHSLRATAATNALDNNADIAKVQGWLGHANLSTARLYDRRKKRPRIARH
jgi:site-specific recombinase XerD